MFFKSVSKDLQILSLIIAFSLFFHLYNFSDKLNFSTDQAKFSLKALELWENKEISLIGPSISLNIDNKEIFQGGVIYYTFLLFLLLGNLDPVYASSAFAFLAVISAIPLFIGIRFLLGKEKALTLTSIYLLAPIFINYTSFLWNPNFQLTLMPLFFLFLGRYKSKRRLIYLIISGICIGVIIQFHYQMVLGLLIVLFWMKLFLKISLKKLSIFILGIIIGFSPLIIFELRNNFYNFNTLIYFAKNYNQLYSSGNFFAHQHYYLSLLLIISVITVSFIRKIALKVVFILIAVLFMWDVFIFVPKPIEGFGMSKNWQYKEERKVFQIIKDQGLENYNFTNLDYDSLYYVQKYFHKTAGLDIKIKNYWEMDKLFAVIKKDEDPDKDPAYEIQVIKPYKEVSTWVINEDYKMYLFEKVKSN